MSDPSPLRVSPPNFRTPRLLGIVNLLFSSQILVCGLGMASYIAVLPIVTELMQTVVKQAEQDAERRKEAELAAIDAETKKAESEVEKAVLAERKRAVEARPKATIPGMVDISSMGLNDSKVLAWSWAEVISGVVVNVLMLVSGVGLMNWKRWGRSLGLWTGWLKILRLVVLYGIFIVVVAPIMSQGMAKMATDMIAQQQAAGIGGGGAPPTQMLAQVYSVMNTSIGVMMILGGVIYPALLIWLLNKPGVKAACSGTFLPPKEPKEPKPS